MTESAAIRTPGAAKFPGYTQLVVLLALLPVVYDGAIFELFSAIDLSIRYLPLGPIDESRLRITSEHVIYGMEEHEAFMLPLGAALVLYPVAVLVCLFKRRWGWLIFGLAMLHVAAWLSIQEVIATRSLFARDAWKQFLPEYVQPASYVSLAWFLMFGRLWSKSFFLFAVLCLAMHIGFTSVSQNESVSQTLFGPLVILIMLSFVGKAVAYGLFQNLYLFKRVGFLRTLWVGMKGFFYWSPMLFLIIIPLLVLSLWTHSVIEKSLYGMTWAYDDYLTRAEKRENRETETLEAIKTNNTQIMQLYSEIDRLNITVKTLTSAANSSKGLVSYTLRSSAEKTRSDIASLREKLDATWEAKKVAESHYRTHQELQDQFHHLNKTLEKDGQQTYYLIQRARGVSHNPEIDLPLSANALVSTYEMAISERLLAFEYYLTNLASTSLTDESVKAVAARFDEVMPEDLGMEGKEYDGFLGAAKTWGSNESAEMVEEGYGKIRSRTRANLLKKVRDLVSENVEPTFDQKREELVGIVEKAQSHTLTWFHDTNRSAQYTVTWGYRWFVFSQYFGTLLFIFVCIRSYLYVLGRVAFDSSEKLYISLEDVRKDNLTLPGSQVRVTDKEYVIKAEGPEKYYFSRKFEPHGYPPKLSIPQPGAAPIGRILHGCYALNRVTMDEHSSRVFFTGQKSEHFVEWTLEPGESVVFDYRNFVGMSESIKLSVHISLRVSSLMLDKVIYPIATGPGKLILCTEGVPHYGDDEHTRSSMPANRLVAWQKDLRFHSESELNFVDIYFSDSYVRKDGEGILIMDADKRGVAKNGLTRFIKHFFLP